MEHVKPTNKAPVANSLENTKMMTESSILPTPTQPVKDNQFKMPTMGLIGTLIVCFFILKFFIYIKDEKRHGK